MEPIQPDNIQTEEGNRLHISPSVQTLLRRWMKERDALENQINGVLQSLVIGHPGVWDLDETTTCMVRRDGMLDSRASEI